MRPVVHFLLLVAALAAATARAEGLDVSTSTHFGYGVISRSAGFENVGGSLAFMDLSVPLADGLDGGLRTLAQGGKGTAAQFYRLGSGPFLSWEAFEDLFLQLTLNAFKESVLPADGGRERSFQGRTAMIGTERLFYRSARVDAGWGGFGAWHGGDGTMSLTRGVDLAVRLRL